MFIIRIGSTCSLQMSDDMPPRKKPKTSVVEPEVVKLESPQSESSEWRSNCKTLQAKYDYVLKNNVLSDIKLVVGEEGTLFNCHRLILAFGSPVFEAMFFGDLAEREDTVTIPDVDPEGFKHLLKFFYTGEFDVQNAATAFKTYFAADKYCVTILKEFCENYLCTCSVTPSNVWLFFENSLFLNSEAIKNSCLYMLSYDLKSSLELNNFLDINLHTMKSLLDLDDLNASEEVILKNVIRWAEHKSKISPLVSFENILKPLLSRIRFGALTPKEFADLRCTTRLKEVVNKDDSLSIFEHLLNPTLCQLPDWCCQKGRRHCLRGEHGMPDRNRPIRSPSKQVSKSVKKVRKIKSPSSSSFSSSSSSSSHHPTLWNYSSTSSSDD